MQPKIIVILVSFLIFFALFVSVPFRIKSVQKKSGKLIFGIYKPASLRTVLVFLLGFVLIALSAAYNGFSLLIRIILCATALLGEEIAIRDIAFSGKSGIYQNGLIVDTKYIPFDDILGSDSDKTLFKLVSKKYGELLLPFKKEEECAEFMQKLFEHKPELNSSFVSG